jgi:branched-chain amino acid transport system ATP-binding protein
MGTDNEPGTAGARPVLQAVDVTVDYGGVRAVNGLNLTVAPGQLVGLIGPNGAGKTSALDALTGFAPASGRVLFRGRDISGLPAVKRAQAGLVRTWQAVELFSELSVSDNVLLTVEAGGVRPLLRDVFRLGTSRRSTGHSRRVAEILAQLEIGDLADRMPDELSNGQRKLAGVARALAGSPGVLLLDEPAAGLDSAESQVLGARLRRLVENGLPLLLIDHDMGMVLSVCDYIYVLDGGLLIAEGTAEQIRHDPKVIASYLGTGGKHDGEADQLADKLAAQG